MISGPTIPGTRDAVWQLVQHRVDRLETGLTLVVPDVEIAPGVVVDGLCRDAASQPVAVMTAMAGDDDVFTGHVQAVRRFLREQSSGLAQLMGGSRIRFGGAARVMVVGLEISAALRDALQPLVSDGVELFRLHSIRVGGELRWMVEPMIGPQAAGGKLSSRNQGSVPGGILDPRLQEVTGMFLRVAARLDPAVTVRGDRFGRVVEHCGEPLAELVFRDGRVLVSVGGDEPEELLVRDDALGLADRMIRVFLANAGVQDAGEDGKRRSAERGARGSDRSLDELRDCIRNSRLTPEEGAAFADVEIWTPELDR